MQQPRDNKAGDADQRADGALVLAHLSDIHLPPPRAYRGHYQAKRVLGMLNWQRRRRHHLLSTLSAIVADMQIAAPDHIAVTGDLVNVGMSSEHEAARRWLASLGPPDHVTAIPGNHDIYVEMAATRGIGHWQAFMADDAPLGAKGPFPFVRRMGAVALVGLNSALPTPLFHAYGRLGPEQIERLGEILNDLGRAGLVRVLLIHHPPLVGQAKHRAALKDADDFAEVLQRHGAELVLHGHNHRAMRAFARGPVRPIPIIGVPSASLGLTDGERSLARYNIYRITADPSSPIEMIERGLAIPGGPVVEIARHRLDAEAAAAT
ncbi:MAG: metallophosphoesterase [Hyphomicrobiaceae bacterium]